MSEPPGFFEALLRGRSYTEPPDLTARVCGICPVAYRTSACGVRVDPVVRDLRRLVYCGEWIESQALHICLPHAPDFLGRASVIDLARTHRAEVERGLRLKKAGNSLMELLGGRAVHPVDVRPGGFHRAPARAELLGLEEDLRQALDDAWDTVHRVSGFEFPDARVEADLLALAAPDTYAVEGGTPTVLRADRTQDSFPVRDFTHRVAETQVPHSTALHSRLDGRVHLTGSRARFAIGGALLSEVARQAAVAGGLGDPRAGAVCRNPFRSVLVRAVETVYAVTEALRIIQAYEPPERPYQDVPPVAGVGHGAAEAPRGVLYHRYELDADGTVTSAVLVPPTARNQGAIEDDLRRLAQRADDPQSRSVRLVLHPFPRPDGRPDLGPDHRRQ